MSKKNRRKPSRKRTNVAVPTNKINQDIADTMMEAKWFDVGDRMVAKSKVKEDREQ